MIKSFIKNPELLEEDYRVEDLLDFSDIVSNFRKRLDTTRGNSMVGVVGPFGSGKSTMLFQLYKDNSEESTEMWLTFDAWKYPERRGLWEGFVLDVSRQIDKKMFDKARREIDGEKKEDWKALLRVLFEGANNFIPGASIGKNFANLFKSSSCRRVFELQDIFKEIIDKSKKDLFIIVEDIDRSGDMGLFFLETLKNFIKSQSFNNKVTIIVPISDDHYSRGKDSYLKVLDYRFDFRVKDVDFRKFIKQIFEDSVFQDTKVLDHLNFLLKQIRGQGFTIRAIKHVLRSAESSFRTLSEKDRQSIDIRMWLLFQLLRDLKENPFNQQNGYYRTNSDFWGQKYILLIARNISVEEYKARSYTGGEPICLSSECKEYVPRIYDRFPGISFQKEFVVVTDQYLRWL